MINKNSASALKQPLLFRTALVLGVILFITLANMVASFLTSENVENDAVRINLAGSLRMQSYRIAEAVLIRDNADIFIGEDHSLEREIAEFEARFNRPVLIGHIEQSRNKSLKDSVLSLQREWSSLKAMLSDNQTPLQDTLVEIDRFVALIDGLVSRLEAQTESKFRLLRLLQLVSLLVTIIVVVIALVDINSNVVVPLQKLLAMAGRLQAGEFSQRLPVNGDDELSTLSRTFNEMSESLEAMYRDLEYKVEEKTLHLGQARDNLSLLYETSRLLSSELPIRERINESMINVSNYFPGFIFILEADDDANEVNQYPQGEDVVAAKNKYHAEFDVDSDTLHYGKMSVYSDKPLQEQLRNLFQTIAENIAVAQKGELQQVHLRRIGLMEERAVIARELHDSLAQSLSYLKIQISRLHMLRDREADAKTIDEVILSIKSGIDSAYRQLRELLVTFRLRLSDEGLGVALEKATNEFSQRGELAIDLDNQIEGVQLTPNEEIHILQIVRESLSNIVRHSEATLATIALHLDEAGCIVVCIRDNGVGLKSNDISSSHYGKIIMQERAQTLSGQIEFTNRPQGGVEVRLVFSPESARKTLRFNEAVS